MRERESVCVCVYMYVSVSEREMVENKRKVSPVGCNTGRLSNIIWRPSSDRLVCEREEESNHTYLWPWA